MQRRGFLQMMLAGTSMLALMVLKPMEGLMAADKDDKIEPVVKSESEWEQILTPQQDDVLRHEGTERPFTSPLLDEHRDGVFACAACGLELFP